MFTLCFVACYFVLGLSFIFSFILHPSCIIIIVRSFISYPHFFLTLCLFLKKRGRVYSREYISECFVISIWLLCTSLGGEILFLMHICRGGRYSIGEMHIPRGRRLWVNKKTLFCLFLFMFVFLYCIVFVYWTCIHPCAIVLYWMHVRMIICFAMWSL